MIADEVQILYDGVTDITNSVLYEKSRFELLMAAAPGQWSITVRDPDRTLNFVTGHEITLILNDEVAYGGVIWEIRKTFMFPAVNTSGDVETRLWVLSGTDFNIILDKRVLRNPAHYNKIIYSPGSSSGSVAIIAPITDGEVIRNHIRFYFDLSGYDTEDPDNIIDNWTFDKGFTWPTQGTRLRRVLEILTRAGQTAYSVNVSIFWFDGEKKLHFIKAQDDITAGWGFSDRPDNSTTFPFREATGVKNAMSLINDAMVWGGTNWTKPPSDIVFARVQDATSIADHNRWQESDVGVGNFEYTTQTQVNLRANNMVNGPPGTFLGKSLGRGVPEQTFTATWLNARVPGLLRPGQVVPITLDVFGDEPIEMPLRSLTISWPGLNEDGSRAWTQFQGQFGLLMSDPSWLWKYLQGLRPGKIVKLVVATANNETSKPPYGALYQDQPGTQAIVGEAIVVTLDPPNGSKTLFHIPFMYIGNTLKVFINGIAQYRGIDYTETSPSLGTFTLFDAPASDDKMWVWGVVAGTLV